MKIHPSIQVITALVGFFALHACDHQRPSKSELQSDLEEATEAANSPDSTPQPSETPPPMQPTGDNATYVGLPLEKAEEAADLAGLRHRVIMEDGEPRMVTKDFHPTRLNFTVEGGVVTAVTNG